MFGQGISREGDILDLAVKENIVEKSGAWYAYQGAKIGQGRENAKIYLRDNPAVCQEVENKVRAAYGLEASSVGDEASAAKEEKSAAKEEKPERKPRGGKAAAESSSSPEAGSEPSSAKEDKTSE